MQLARSVTAADQHTSPPPSRSLPPSDLIRRSSPSTPGQAIELTFRRPRYPCRCYTQIKDNMVRTRQHDKASRTRSPRASRCGLLLSPQRASGTLLTKLAYAAAPRPSQCRSGPPYAGRAQERGDPQRPPRQLRYVDEPDAKRGCPNKSCTNPALPVSRRAPTMHTASRLLRDDIAMSLQEKQIADNSCRKETSLCAYQRYTSRATMYVTFSPFPLPQSLRYALRTKTNADPIASLPLLHRLNTYEFPKKSSSTLPKRKRTSRAPSAAVAAVSREAITAVAVEAIEAVEVVAAAVVDEVVAGGDSER